MRVPARALSVVAASLCLLAAPVQASAACPGADARPTASTLGETRTAVLCLLNEERTSRGMGRLRANAKLRRAAEQHSRNMSRNDFFDHVSPGGSTPLDRIKGAGYLDGAGAWAVAENIAYGQQHLATPREIVRAWMASPGHRTNILNRRFRHVGIGVSIGTPLESGGGATYTTAFGKR